MTFTTSMHDTNTYCYTTNKFNMMRYFDCKNFSYFFVTVGPLPHNGPTQTKHVEKMNINKCLKITAV